MESGDNSDTIASGSKRSFSDVEDDENDNPGSKKVCTKVEEADPSVAAAVILSLQESLQKCKDHLTSSHDELVSCEYKLYLTQNELESSQTEVNKWKSAFEKESFVPARTSPEPGFVIDYIEKLRSSETALKEQLEIAQMKLAIYNLKAQLKPAQSQLFTTNEGREVKIKQESTAVAGPSHKVTHLKEVEVDKNDGGTSSPPALLDEFQAAKKFITLLAGLKESKAKRQMEIDKLQAERVEFVTIFADMDKKQAERLMKMEKEQAERAETIESYDKAEKFLLQKFPSLVPPSTSEDADE